MSMRRPASAESPPRSLSPRAAARATPRARALLAALTIAALVPAGLGGCLEPRPPVNRVQPNYLDKEDFIPVEYRALTTGSRPEELTAAQLAREPVFYTQTTLLSKPSTTGFLGITSYSEVDKVRWEVTEHFLLARRSFSYVRGAPRGEGGIGDNPRNGEVVAAYAIDSHFDIRRQYNASTGEEANVLEENTSDRPWYTRRYMRVDWSRNLIEGYHSVFEYEEWSGLVNAEPVPVQIDTPNDPNRPVFEYRTGSSGEELVYFDVTNRAVLHPETVNLGEGYEHVPVCYLGSGETDCAPADVTLRMSFRRADPGRDYEPASLSLPTSGDTSVPHHLDMERFGFFDQSRVGWDRRNNTVLDTQRMHFASRHNLWAWHHAPVFGADTSTLCNRDADCSNGNVCRIGNAPVDASHRGVCAPLALQHLGAAGALPGTDISCQTDSDCRPTPSGGGVSSTAVCDTSTNTCAEHFVRCGSDADCASIDPQSTCDTAIAYYRPDNRGLCTLPFRRRQVRPVAYHVSPNYPDRMLPVTEAVVREWNDAFRQAVTASRRRECQVENGIDGSSARDDEACNAPSVTGLDEALGADARFAFVGCHNPVWGADASKPGAHTQDEVNAAHAAGWDLPDACGPQGTSARLGDLRYSMIGGINDYDMQGYWGLANIASDPETGEMVAGRGAVWQTITDQYAAWLTDLTRLLNGQITEEQISNGQYLAASMRQLASGQTPAAEALDAPFRHAGSLDELSHARTGLDAMRQPDAGWMRPDGRVRFGTRGSNQRSAFDVEAERLRASRMLGDGTNASIVRGTRLRGTPLESRMMNEDQVRISRTARADGTGALDSTIDRVSPFRARHPAVRHAIEQLRSRMRAWECNYEAAFSDDVVIGLARRMASGNPIRASNPDEAEVAYGRDWEFRQSDGTLDYEKVREYLTQYIHQGVLAHEIGHSLGQRHNFTGSADSMNYHDRYWQLRGRGHRLGVRPRYEYLNDPMDGHYYSTEEANGRLEEYAYSTVMDYKGFNEDAHGLGRYDYAFIANGYTNLVQAFRRVASNAGADMWYVNYSGSALSTPFDLREWAGGGAIKGLHYTQMADVIGRRSDGAPDVRDDNRYYVFLRETRSQDVDGWGSPSFTNVTTDGHRLVPFMFDSDDRAGLVWQNQRQDAGADAYESMHYVAERYLNYYFANSFARFRTGFSVEGYIDRQWGRYVDQLRQCTQTTAFDLISDEDFFATSPGWLAYRNDPAQRAGYVSQAAMSVVADAFIGQLTMPEMGTHAVRNASDGRQFVTPDFTVSRGIEIPINTGRIFETGWRNDVGYFWWEQLDRAGAYYDKVLALEALSDPELSLLGRDTPTDIRLFQLSFYTMYPEQMTRLFGALLAEDYADFAPIINTRGDNAVQRTHLATLNLPPGTGAGRSGRVLDTTHQPLDPQTHFTLQLWSAVYSAWLFPATYDQRYMDYARMWFDGSADAVQTRNPETDTVSFEDPWTHQTYRALHVGTGEGEAGQTIGASPLVHAATGMTANEAGVAARMLLHARDIDTIRRNAIRDNDPATAARLETELRKYVDLLNIMRAVTHELGGGAL